MLFLSRGCYSFIAKHLPVPSRLTPFKAFNLVFTGPPFAVLLYSNSCFFYPSMESDCGMSPIGSYIKTLGAQLLELILEGCGTFRGDVLMEEVDHWGVCWGFITQSPFLLPVYFPSPHAVWPSASLFSRLCPLCHNEWYSPETINESKHFLAQLHLSGCFLTATGMKLVQRLFVFAGFLLLSLYSKL